MPPLGRLQGEAGCEEGAVRFVMSGAVMSGAVMSGAVMSGAVMSTVRS